MILVDTSIWVDHFRRSDRKLVDLLNSGEVLAHPFVIGEIALGVLRDRETVIGLLRDLPAAKTATDDEALAFISANRLQGRGVGYVDAHLLAATRLTPRAALWTRDRRLAEAAEDLNVAARFN
ncbi:MAG: PIN domain-containing protein [Beijerinckiaceae bacterium]